MIKLQTSASFRSISEIFSILSEKGGLGFGSPSHTTILLWVKKTGLYHMEQPKTFSDDWVIIIDESVEFGNEKLLMVLGIREKDIDFTNPLSYQDLTCLATRVSDSWKGEDIKGVLGALCKKIGKIKYAVADMGNGIKKGLGLLGIDHVEDITHKLSWFLKQLYQEDERFVSYTKKLAYLRGSLPLSKLAYILPPAQRVNSRFMNLKPIIDWGKSVLKMLKNKKGLKAEREKLCFIQAYQGLINEMDQVLKITIETQRMLKNNGLSGQTFKQCMKLFHGKTNFEKIKQLKNMLKGYLHNMLDIAKKNKSEKLLFTSDILESSFGKYKNYINQSPGVGITDLCLSISAFTFNYENDEKLLQAMQATKVEELHRWSKENIGKTLKTRRLEVLGKNRGRKKS